MSRKRLHLTLPLALAPCAGVAHAQAPACVRAPAPVAKVAAASLYSDAAGSVADKQGMHQSYVLTLPVRNFVTQLSRLADSARAEDRQCARNMLADWSASRALLVQPDNFVGIRERQRYAIAIDVAAIKLMSKGVSLPPAVIDWIGTLNARVMADFGRRNAIDNLNAWSGVNAQLTALITRDPAASAYADKVWRESIAQIGADGLLPSELKRARKALDYHQYYADALFMLRAARSGAGKAPTAEEDGSLRALATRIDRELCDGAGLRQKTGIEQAKPSGLNVPVALAFGAGFPTQNWKSCASGAWSFNDPTFGGDLRAAASAIAGRR